MWESNQSWRFCFSVTSKVEAKIEDAETWMPSEASWPGAESQKSDKFEKQRRVHPRTQDRCYQIHVLLAQRWQHLSDQEGTDHQLSKGELWSSGYSIHRWGWRSNHRIKPPFSNSWNTLCWCATTVVLFRKGTVHLVSHTFPSLLLQSCCGG